jgi:hypothetical protein
MTRLSNFGPRLLLAHAIPCLVLFGATIGTQSLAQQSTDGPVLVNLGDVFRKGSVKIEDAALTSLPPLPQGYAALSLLLGVLTIAAQNRTEKSPNSPISISLEDFFKKGNITIEDADVSQLP